MYPLLHFWILYFSKIITVPYFKNKCDLFILDLRYSRNNLPYMNTDNINLIVFMIILAVM